MFFTSSIPCFCCSSFISSNIVLTAFISLEPMAFCIAAVKSLPPPSFNVFAVAKAEIFIASMPETAPLKFFAKYPVCIPNPLIFSCISGPRAFAACSAASDTLFAPLFAISLNFVMKLIPSF